MDDQSGVLGVGHDHRRATDRAGVVAGDRHRRVCLGGAGWRDEQRYDGEHEHRPVRDSSIRYTSHAADGTSAAGRDQPGESLDLPGGTRAAKLGA